ncbi:alpha-1,3-mannosyl-glycoprotein 4-beta-N-acetylglucosaminyltransferase C-like [Xenia sp. Carnegie-2017]|uniref:alpha-1,3-mannosyl-glycoprotein 4-beta-N-acetylglucosaminyltransferase C-like n=1 Tax=Xenia sp. Carnegie-2017 TaxID=2897299 RepID=UPI001F04D072|nr:alpha-1,3-mannosyl-glycoprotein 4-beta-N-acetylglucosaminyltransferase C-like [Xenia sp. Carnegie-2017]
MSFPKRKCWTFLKKLVVVLIFACVCKSLLNFLCFDGECDDNESQKNAFSLLSDVVLEANRLTIVENEKTRFSETVISPSIFKWTTESNLRNKVLNVTAKLLSMQMKSLDLCPSQDDFLKNGTLMTGKKSFGKKKFLSVGIPSISRKRKSYLETSLTSIIEAIANRKQNNITIVVFLADRYRSVKEQQLKKLINKFGNQISSGMLQIIEAPDEYYAPLHNLHRSLGDKMNRVLWRSKQALDYVYLMCFCSYISDYYLQLEDDVTASPRFLSKIEDFIHSQKTSWISLNVALLGYIGKLYPRKEVQNLASYLKLFYDEMPVDWLEPRWKDYRGQDPATTPVIAASLFQHIGRVSSFQYKEWQRPNTLKEKIFDRFDHKYAGLNPPAIISTDLTPISGQPSDAYNKGIGFFHAHFASAGNKMYMILLKRETKLARVAVETGANFSRRDVIVTASLEISNVVGPMSRCEDYQKVGEFHFGRVDVPLNGVKVRCIRINIIYQGLWIYLREINVWPQ